jgi:hypothetical protein
LHGVSVRFPQVQASSDLGDLVAEEFQVAHEPTTTAREDGLSS